MVLRCEIAEIERTYNTLKIEKELTSIVVTLFSFSSSSSSFSSSGSSSSSIIRLKFGLCLTARGKPFPPPYERKSPGTTNFLFTKKQSSIEKRPENIHLLL